MIKIETNKQTHKDTKNECAAFLGFGWRKTEGRRCDPSTSLSCSASPRKTRVDQTCNDISNGVSNFEDDFLVLIIEISI